MNINLYKNYYLKSDPLCLILYQKIETKKKNSEDEYNEYEKVLGYYTSIEDSLVSLCKNEVRSCKCTTLTGLVKEIKKLEKMIWALCEKLDAERMVKHVIELNWEGKTAENNKKNKKEK